VGVVNCGTSQNCSGINNGTQKDASPKTEDTPANVTAPNGIAIGGNNSGSAVVNNYGPRGRLLDPDNKKAY
jgi:hypothetical protein